jgi:hypothetical protein
MSMMIPVVAIYGLCAAGALAFLGILLRDGVRTWQPPQEEDGLNPSEHQVSRRSRNPGRNQKASAR